MHLFHRDSYSSKGRQGYTLALLKDHQKACHRALGSPTVAVATILQVYTAHAILELELEAASNNK